MKPRAPLLAAYIAVGCAAAFAMVPTGAADCAPSWFVPTLLTSTNAAVPDGTSLLVYATPDFRHPEYRPGAFARGFALTRRGQRVPLRVEQLGGGLARLTPTRSLGVGLWRVEGLTTAASINIAHNAQLPPAPAAPSEVYISMPRMPTRDRYSDELVRAVRVELSAPAPHPALVAYWGGTALAAASFNPADRDAILYYPPGGCIGAFPGTRAPARGETRELAWVDQYGRVSPRYRVP